MPSDVLSGSVVRGEVRGHHVTGASENANWRRTWYAPSAVSQFRQRTGRVPGWSPVTPYLPNKLLYEWGEIFGSLLLRRGVQYGVGGMYIEFENVGTPGDPVAAPSFERGPGEGVAYYNDLASSGDRDYLRVPLVAGTMDSTDQTKYPGGNRPILFAQTVGVAGVHGKPFSDANNSVVFGGALVAFVDETDHTRDLVLSRFYFTVENQMPKLANGQVGLEWRLVLQ